MAAMSESAHAAPLRAATDRTPVVAVDELPVAQAPVAIESAAREIHVCFTATLLAPNVARVGITS
jgi:hypothetical protein